MEVVINTCFGGFDLSIKGKMLYCEKKYGQVYLYKIQNEKLIKIKYTEDIEHKSSLNYAVMNIDLGNVADQSNEYNDNIIWNFKLASYECRTDPALIETVKELQSEANGFCSNLKIVTIPDDVEWVISDYDGKETIEEKHRSWS